MNTRERRHLFFKYSRRNFNLYGYLLFAASLTYQVNCNASPEKADAKISAFTNYEKLYHSKDTKQLSLLLDENFNYVASIDYLGTIADSRMMNKEELLELFKKNPDPYPAPSSNGGTTVEKNDAGYCVTAKDSGSSTGIEETFDRKVCFSKQGKVISHLIQYIYIYESQK